MNEAIIFAEFQNEPKGLNVCMCLGWYNSLFHNLMRSISNFILLCIYYKTKTNWTHSIAMQPYGRPKLKLPR